MRSENEKLRSLFWFMPPISFQDVFCSDTVCVPVHVAARCAASDSALRRNDPPSDAIATAGAVRFDTSGPVRPRSASAPESHTVHETIEPSIRPTSGQSNDDAVYRARRPISTLGGSVPAHERGPLIDERPGTRYRHPT